MTTRGDPVTVWVIWSLRAGIEKVDATWAKYPSLISYQLNLFMVGKNAFLSRDEAIAGALTQRDRKIDSARRLIQKLQSMSFDAPE